MTATRKQELAQKDVAHLLHPLGIIGKAPGLIFERGKGVHLWDTEGKQYIDMSSGGVHCVNLGFGRQELIDAAHEQMQKISYISAHYPWSNVPAIEYAAELAKVLPGDINHVYTTCSGTESVEVAIQIARTYWDAQGHPGKYKIICLHRAYHGGSLLTRSIVGGHVGMGGIGRAVPGIVRMPSYHPCYNPFSSPVDATNFLETVIEQEGEDTISCLIAEVVQGNGGVLWPPDEYWPITRKICTEHNILLIGDEVQTGFCRTGKFWGLQHWNVVPDIMTMAKGINASYLPFGAVGFSDKIYKALPQGKLFMSYTTSDANPVVVATARAALKVFVEEKIADKVAKLGEHLHDRLVKEFLPLPCVDNVMGKGLYQSFEIALNKTTGSQYNPEATVKARDYITNKCLEKGVILTALDGYPRWQPIAPPLVINQEELDTAIDVLLGAMKEVKPV